MFDVSRDQARQFFFDVRKKSQQSIPLTPIEDIALTIIQHHPEYHAMLDNPQRYLDKDWRGEEGVTNPFLHLGLHLAIEEQLSIDQPPGIKSHYERLCYALKDEHQARHILLESLTEMIWQAQVNQEPFNNHNYLLIIEERLKQLGIEFRP
ncbi:MAG: DUF1841 family protein [Betaproteobacteria bacterium]|uniref:DUF1841 family protein n=1 Tax=Ferrovum sp. PN-J185 TaxID=1356306 RepID=UPI00082F023F|nr:DUF1841 family protein [Ferrovum sp. PN-J185]MDE1891995.1 DUF1841 family protein [Betaproteobacteria bacterium]MDE2056556.1 DUF1841 family protein [Betaproteobacteria bacterium]